MQTAENAAIVIAIVQAVKGLVPTQVHGWVTIIVAGLVGAALAFTQSSDIIQGVVDGLIGAGVVTVASRVGK